MKNHLELVQSQDKVEFEQIQGRVNRLYFERMGLLFKSR